MASYKLLFSILLLSLTISYAAAARILDEDVVPGVPTTAPGSTVGTGGPVRPIPTTASGAIPATGSAIGGGGAVPPGTIPAAGSAVGGAGAVAPDDPHHPFVFYMHDIIGGSNPTARAVTGIVTNPAINGQLPFAKPNGANLPVNNGVDINSNNNGVINNNNVPFLTGLGGNSANGIQNQNNGNNQINGQSGLPVLSGGQLPAGSTIEKFMFGTLTVIDDELTEGHELGSGLVGKAQGFYIASSIDGSSQTMAFTAMFEDGGYVDTLSFFGVHRTAVSESQLAIMGGTGKFVNAKGFATVKTFPGINQHETDGVETLLQFTLYLAY